MPNALLDILLTSDAKQRVRLVQAGIASALMLLAIILMHAMTWLGLNDGKGLWLWSVVSEVGLVMMFMAIRLGWSARLLDPSLTVPQLLFAVASCAVAYRIAGAGHGAPLLMLGVILMFGMFGLNRKRAWLVGAYSIGAFGLAMSSAARAYPDVYETPVQTAYFVVLVFFVFGFMVVGGRVAALREQLRSQTAALAEAFERITILATHDELTGLLNRRAMTALLETERERSVRAGHQWSAAMLDIDYFKRVNDVYGHAAGDEALRSVARVCTSMVRKCDSVSRWGGEEFLFLFRDAEPELVIAAAERVRIRIAATLICFGDRTFSVTVSIGVAAHLSAEEAAGTVARADVALYEAKESGRNRVCSTP